MIPQYKLIMLRENFTLVFSRTIIVRLTKNSNHKSELCISFHHVEFSQNPYFSSL
mgnify:CR=1 FL=1